MNRNPYAMDPERERLAMHPKTGRPLGRKDSKPRLVTSAVLTSIRRAAKIGGRQRQESVSLRAMMNALEILMDADGQREYAAKWEAEGARRGARA